MASDTLDDLFAITVCSIPYDKYIG
jgi:hypothetical protein